MKKIDLHFEKLYRYPRIGEPCAVTIPCREGELTDLSRGAILQKGQKAPSQMKVLARHRDGSVKFLFVRFLADLPGNEGTVLTFDPEYREAAETGQPVEALQTSNRGESADTCQGGGRQAGILCRETTNGYEADCGLIHFSVVNNSDSLFGSFHDGYRTYSAGQFQGPFLKTDGESYGIRFGHWEIAEAGDVCLVLKAEALCVGERHIECGCRITAYLGKPWIEISFTLKNTTLEELHAQAFTFSLNVCSEGKTDSSLITDRTGETLKAVGTAGIEELEKQLDVRSVRTAVGTSNYKTRFEMAQNGTPLSLRVDADFLMKEGNEHLAEVLYGTFFADRTDSVGGVCATVFQAHQNYPKAVKADRESVQVMLVPEDVDRVVMEPGMAREQRFMLYFHSPQETMTEIDNRSLIYQMPDRPVLAPEVYRDAEIFPEIFPEKKDDTTEAWLITRCDSHARCFGMLNWGDAPDPGYTAQGRALGELVWTNNEYDFPHACLLQYVRTGQRRFLDYALVAGSHWKDVDVCHYSDDPLIMGGQWEHTGGHVKNGSIVCSHEWVEGLLDCYHFTGDESYLETAVGIGENVLRLLETPMYQNSGEISARETGWALRTLTALYTETREERWVARADWIVGQFREWAGKFGHWLAPYTDNVLIRVPFMISVAVGSLMRYYQEFPSLEIKEMILEAVDDMVENSMFDNGFFYYKEIPSLTRLGNNTLILEALTYAYRLTGRTEYLECGRKTFGMNLKSSPDYIVFPKKVVKDALVYGNQPTKNFAQSFLPMTVYYTALSENGMI